MWADIKNAQARKVITIIYLFELSQHLFCSYLARSIGSLPDTTISAFGQMRTGNPVKNKGGISL